MTAGDTQWPRYHVFHQEGLDQPHINSGSVHATDGEMALQNARDVFARRPDCVSLWVVPAAEIQSLTADELERIGYNIIIFASDVQRAAIVAMQRLLRELHDKRTAEFFDDMVTFQERERIVNTAHYLQLQEQYLRMP